MLAASRFRRFSEEGTSMLFELAAAHDGVNRDVVSAFNNRILRPCLVTTYR